MNLMAEQADMANISIASSLGRSVRESRRRGYVGRIVFRMNCCFSHRDFLYLIKAIGRGKRSIAMGGFK
jgi:hypothetical protein